MIVERDVAQFDLTARILRVRDHNALLVGRLIHFLAAALALDAPAAIHALADLLAADFDFVLDRELLAIVRAVVIIDLLAEHRDGRRRRGLRSRCRCRRFYLFKYSIRANAVSIFPKLLVT